MGVAVGAVSVVAGVGAVSVDAAVAVDAGERYIVLFIRVNCPRKTRLQSFCFRHLVSTVAPLRALLD